MKSFVYVVAVLCGLNLAPVQAQTLRWSSQGDPTTMDPHSQNELLTNSIRQIFTDGSVSEVFGGENQLF